MTVDTPHTPHLLCDIHAQIDVELHSMPELTIVSMHQNGIRRGSSGSSGSFGSSGMHEFGLGWKLVPRWHIMMRCFEVI
jgi:hypothetical protein